MDKHFAKLEIYSPGIVIFDPVVLDFFTKKNNVTSDNLFEVFLDSEDLGRAVIDEGVLIPIYEIPESEYSVFYNTVESDASMAEQKFRYQGFPLRIDSGLVVVADLNALFEWDSDFFLNYKENYSSRLPSNDYLDVHPGLYSVTIAGYEGLQRSLISKGYGLTFQAVEKLPEIRAASAVDDRDFSL